MATATNDGDPRDRLNKFVLPTVDLDHVAVGTEDGRVAVSRPLSEHDTEMHDVHDLAREHGLTAIDSRVPEEGDRLVVEFTPREGI